MFSRFGDESRDFALLDEFRRRLDRVWEDMDPSWSASPSNASTHSSTAWPRVNLYDGGSSLVLKADVPGLSGERRPRHPHRERSFDFRGKKANATRGVLRSPARAHELSFLPQPHLALQSKPRADPSVGQERRADCNARQGARGSAAADRRPGQLKESVRWQTKLT